MYKSNICKHDMIIFLYDEVCSYVENSSFWFYFQQDKERFDDSSKWQFRKTVWNKYGRVQTLCRFFMYYVLLYEGQKRQLLFTFEDGCNSTNFESTHMARTKRSFTTIQPLSKIWIRHWIQNRNSVTVLNQWTALLTIVRNHDRNLK